MFACWAVVSACEVESYVRGLMLPDYLSHLTMDPLSFDRQGHNTDGRLPLILTYRGPGRLEEFALDPASHAAGLLQKLEIKLDAGRLRFSPSDALWNWSLPESGDFSDADSPLRVFFQPSEDAFPAVPQKYEPENAYVSVSRHEIFLAPGVLTNFVTSCCRGLLAVDSPFRNQEAAVQFTSGTGTFRFGPICGRIIPDQTALAYTLIRFADLEKPLEQVALYFDKPIRPGRLQIAPDGVRIPLREEQ